MTLMEGGSEQYGILIRSLLLRASKSDHAISIEVSDRKYARVTIYHALNEMGIDNIAVVFPDKKGEVWLVPKKLEEVVNGKSS